MLKTVFIGSNNPVNELLVNWLAEVSDLRGVVWTQSTKWRRSLRGIYKFTMRRLSKYGVWKVLDEALYFAIFNALLRARTDRQMLEGLVKPNRRPARWKQVPQVESSDINSAETREFIQKCESDAAFGVCVNEYFGARLRSIPRLGCYLWHEGITPEYRGLYSAFWAIKNRDYDKLGCTLLSMNDVIDGGPVYVQEIVGGFDLSRHTPGYIGHKAILDSLEKTGKFIEELEAGTATPIPMDGRVDGCYTYPGLTDYLGYRFGRRRKRQ